MLCRGRYCRLSARLSVSLSVTFKYRDHVDWNYSKIISWLVSLWCSLFADPNTMGLLQWKHREILAGTGVGYGKKWLSA